jgi:hypothetical protein
MENPSQIWLRSEVRLRNLTLLRLFLRAVFPFSGKATYLLHPTIRINLKKHQQKDLSAIISNFAYK